MLYISNYYVHFTETTQQESIVVGCVQPDCVPYPGPMSGGYVYPWYQIPPLVYRPLWYTLGGDLGPGMQTPQKGPGTRYTHPPGRDLGPNIPTPVKRMIDQSCENITSPQKATVAGGND